jgi:hypothetical protein
MAAMEENTDEKIPHHFIRSTFSYVQGKFVVE